MPIDWEAIVAPFRAVFQSQMKYFTESVREIALWLKKRLEDTRTTEQLSRAYPVIDFTEGSVQASIALFQQHTLGLPKEIGGPRPIDEYLSGWQRFARGFQRIPEAMEEALALPRLVHVVEEVTGTILDSINRWEKPDWRMFDTKQPRSFSDLFGEIFFFAEMLSLSVDPIRVVLNSEVAKLVMAPSKGAKTEDSGDTLAQVVQYMVSALLLLPLGGMWLASLFRWGILSLRVTVSKFLTGIEDRIYSLRRKALEFVVGKLVTVLESAFLFVEGSKLLLLRAIFLILEFGTDVLTSYKVAIRKFLSSLSEFLIKIDLLLTHILLGLEGVMYINVLKLYTWGAVTGTVKQVIEIVTKKDWATYQLLRANVLLYGSAASIYDVSIFGKIWPKHVGERVDALLTILDILGNLPDKEVPNINLPDAASAFPNLHDYFTTLNTVDLPGTLKSLRGTLETQLPAMLDSAGDALTKMGDEFARSAGSTAAIGPLSDVTRVRDFADTTAASLFGGQERDIREHLKRDALAAAFDLAVASGGFHIVGAAIPLYVESMREFWEQKPPESAEPLPTSPHILAKRERLGCVKVPAIRILTSGRTLDDPLISRVAAEFRRAVQGAWMKGLEAAEAGA